MLPKLFVDTSAWYAIADKGDNNHQSALICRHKITKKYHINNVFTFDHHFQQMGFTCNLF